MTVLKPHLCGWHASLVRAFLYCLTLLPRPSLTIDIDFDIDNQIKEIGNLEAAVTCTGDLPSFDYQDLFRPGDYGDMEWPRRPEQQTVQQLCAQAQYGGSVRPWNFETFCIKDDAAAAEAAADLSGTVAAEDIVYEKWRPVVNQDILPLNDVATQLGTKAGRIRRMVAFCIQRCTCSGVLPAKRLPKPSYLWTKSNVEIDLSRREGDPAYTPAEGFADRVSERKCLVRYSAKRSLPRPVRRPDLSIEGAAIGLHLSNLITCPGQLPAFILPSRVNVATFMWPAPETERPHALGRGRATWRGTPWQDLNPHPLTRLCAVALSGGHNDFNAGGYCHISSSDPARRRAEIWFADEMTPNLDWTFRPPPTGNPSVDREKRLRSVTLKQYCARECRCANPEVHMETTSSNLLLDQANAMQALLGEGATEPGEETTTPQEGEEAPGGSATSSSPVLQQALQCQVSCSSQGDCANARRRQQPIAPGCGQEVGELCVAHPVSHSCTSGSSSSPASPPAATPAAVSSCLNGMMALFASAFCMSAIDVARNRKAGGWNGRGPGTPGGRRRKDRKKRELVPQQQGPGDLVEGGEDTQYYHGAVGDDVSMDPWCACNVSYVSVGCCASTDGIIWEEAGSKFGRLVESIDSTRVDL